MINLLIVDDEEQIREGIKSGIDWPEYGVNIVGTVSSAFEALSVLESSTPHVLILDIKMSEMDGLELLEIVHQKYPATKVILMSGYDEFAYAQKAVSLGAFCYLLKPVDSKDLLNKVLEVKKIVETQLDKVKADEEFNKRYVENIPILRDNFFSAMVNGKFIDINFIRDKAQFLKIDLINPEYMILIFDMGDIDRNNNMNIFDQGLFKSAIMSTADNLFSKDHKCYTFNLDNNIGMLICGDQINRISVMSSCKALKEWTNTSLDISLLISMGKTYTSILNIQYSYRDALEALEYKFILGKNEIIDFEHLCQNEETKLTQSSFQQTLEKRENDLIKELKKGNIIGTEKLFDDIITVLQNSIEKNIKLTDRLIFILSFFLTKILIAVDINTDNFFGEENNIYTKMKKLQTIDEIKSFIMWYLHEVIAELEERQKNSNSFLVEKAVEFINSNIYNDVSLKKVADALYIHPNYLSKIFKLELEESFVEYVTKIKMEEAKKLLKTSTYKVYQIADILNYKDINHFTRLFKKAYGLSPSEYREIG